MSRLDFRRSQHLSSLSPVSRWQRDHEGSRPNAIGKFCCGYGLCAGDGGRGQSRCRCRPWVIRVVSQMWRTRFIPEIRHRAFMNTRRVLINSPLRFTPESRHVSGHAGMSAVDQKQTSDLCHSLLFSTDRAIAGTTKVYRDFVDLAGELEGRLVSEINRRANILANVQSFAN